MAKKIANKTCNKWKSVDAARWNRKQLEDEEFIRQLKKYDYVRLSFPDLNGIHLSKLVSCKLAEKIVSQKCEIYSGVITFGPRLEIINVPKVVESKHVNGVLKPDSATLHPLPWKNYNLPSGKEAKICGLICDIAWPNKETLAAHPRYTAHRMIKRLFEEHKLVLYSAFEPEFRVFQPDSIVDTSPKFCKSMEKLPAPRPYIYGDDMYKTDMLEIFEKFFITLDDYMEQLNIPIQDFSNENGEAQLETPMLPNIGLATADEYFTYKQSIREISRKFGMITSFMTKPLPNCSSSGCHYNHSLWDTNLRKNAMYDPEKENNLSETALHWLGGILEHLPSILALSSPTVNCYRRLHKLLAPHMCNWDIDDRFVSIRVRNVDNSRTYVENRLPSSAGCPYHIMAATVAAGLDGLNRKLTPPAPGIKDASKAKPLPNSLAEALEILQNDKHFVDIIGKEFIDWYIQVKRRGDLTTLKNVDMLTETDETMAMERYEYLKYI